MRSAPGLTGRVLEIGFGSGFNLAVLPAAVTRSTRSSRPTWRGRGRRSAAAESQVPVERVGLDGQRIAPTTRRTTRH